MAKTKQEKKGKSMIRVELKANTNVDPWELASHAALKCYQAEDPEWGKTIDVENRLFAVGHHTTLQHFFFTFSIEGIAVGDITFGMHLAHPFYNSDQRSGRYCAKMFLEPDFPAIESYIKKFWPEVKADKRKDVMIYIKNGVGLYHKNIAAATELAREFIWTERPFANEQYIGMNAPKIAQEQMRNFIPVIFPTGFDFTVNLTVLAAMHRVAWTPVMRNVTEQMAVAVIDKFPELEFMFSEKEVLNEDWAPDLLKAAVTKIKYKPAHKLREVFSEKDFIMPESGKMHPVDLLHFDPRMMNNSGGEILSETEISTATMGQDQRHRTIRRSQPNFSGNFYLPPIPKKLKLEKEAQEFMRQWVAVSKEIPATLAMILAPYGAMVKYKKSGSFNAIAHEQAKRLCFCTQEEIYHAGRALRLEIEKKRGKKSKLLQIFEPPCYRTGRCAEGARYCGRDLKLRKTGDYFPERKV
jgi:thymidylate synthase ThyX